MKKLLSIFLLLTICTFVSFSQGHGARTYHPHYVKNVNQGEFVEFGDTIVGDSLCVSDTQIYIFPITHTNQIIPYGQLYWKKRLAGTATIVVSYWQTNKLPNSSSYFAPTNTDWISVKHNYNKAAYTKTLTYTAYGWQDLNWANDSAIFEGRYLKVRLVTSGTSTVSGKIMGRFKFNAR